MRIYVVPEGAEGTSGSVIIFVEELLKENLGIPGTKDLQIERVHRAPDGGNMQRHERSLRKTTSNSRHCIQLG